MTRRAVSLLLGPLSGWPVWVFPVYCAIVYFLSTMPKVFRAARLASAILSVQVRSRRQLQNSALGLAHTFTFVNEPTTMRTICCASESAAVSVALRTGCMRRRCTGPDWYAAHGRLAPLRSPRHRAVT